MRVKAIELAPWNWWGYIVTECTGDQCMAWAKKHHHTVPAIGPHQDGHAVVETGRPWIMWVEDSSAKAIPTLAHETFHIVTQVLDSRGMKLTNESDEAYAYGITYLLRAALNPKGWKEVKP